MTNPWLTAVVDTLERVRNGVSPYEGGPFDTNQMLVIADAFSKQVQHDHFVLGLQKRIESSHSAEEWIRGYMSVVFAQGFSAGSRYEMLKQLEG